MVQTHLDQKNLKINMQKKIKNTIIKFYYYFNNKGFSQYCLPWKNKLTLGKVTTKFLTNLIRRNSKVEKQNSKFFYQFNKERSNDLSDDEEFFMQALTIFLIIFVLWFFLLFSYFLFF